jgi:hypothetical protein
MTAVELKEIHTAYIMAAFLRADEACYGPALSRVDHTTRPTATTNNAPEVRLWQNALARRRCQSRIVEITAPLSPRSCYAGYPSLYNRQHLPVQASHCMQMAHSQ